MIPITLILGGGISLNKITVTVTLSNQSPVSAKGKRVCNLSNFASGLVNVLDRKWS